MKRVSEVEAYPFDKLLSDLGGLLGLLAGLSVLSLVELVVYGLISLAVRMKLI